MFKRVIVVVGVSALLLVAACERETLSIASTDATKTVILNFKYDDLVETVDVTGTTSLALAAVNVTGGMSVFADADRVGFTPIDQDTEMVLPAGARELSIAAEARYKLLPEFRDIFGGEPEKVGFVDISMYGAGDRFRLDCKFNFLRSFTEMGKYKGSWATDCTTTKL